MFTVGLFLITWKWFFFMYNKLQWESLPLCHFPSYNSGEKRCLYSTEPFAHILFLCQPVIINKSREYNENTSFTEIVGHFWWSWLRNRHTLSVLAWVSTPNVQSMVIFEVSHLKKVTNHRTLQSTCAYHQLPQH